MGFKNLPFLIDFYYQKMFLEVFRNDICDANVESHQSSTSPMCHFDREQATQPAKTCWLVAGEL